MYEERKEKFSFKSFFLTLLLVLLFIFLMLWLFPTRSYVDNKLKSTYDIESLSVMYDEIFANNVERMKDAAVGYFTTERLPKKVGESKKLTLKEMINLHLVLKLKDRDGRECDQTKSYVEITKYEEEYRLKVNLSCGKAEDYIIVYLGCYNYCPNGVCEKRVTTPEPIVKHTCKVIDGKYYDKEGKVVDKTAYDKSCNPEPVVKTKLYEYKLEVSDKTTCNDWSNWQKESVSATNLKKVETKTEKEVSGYKTVEYPETVKETVKKEVTEKYVVKNIVKLVLTGTKDIKVDTTTETKTERVKVGSVEVDTGVIHTGTKVPANTDTMHYKVISTSTRDDCSYCENSTVYAWREYKVEPVYDVVEKTVEIPVYKTVNVYEQKTVPVYDYRTVEVEEEVEKTITKTKQVPEYKDVTYYRYQTCEFKAGYTDIKWSKSNDDKELINKGYKLTGNEKEV